MIAFDVPSYSVRNLSYEKRYAKLIKSIHPAHPFNVRYTSLLISFQTDLFPSFFFLLFFLYFLFLFFQLDCSSTNTMWNRGSWMVHQRDHWGWRRGCHSTKKWFSLHWGQISGIAETKGDSLSLLPYLTSPFLDFIEGDHDLIVI